MTEVVAGTRLHFGLFSAGGRFGGCGLMLQQPAITLRLREDSSGWTVAGSLGDRAARYARMATDFEDRDTRSWQVFADGPAEHVGLGVGTALGLSVALAVSLGERMPPDADEQALQVGRGKRSGIGLHGFRLGGFLIDAGKPTGARLPELAGRTAFPDDWRIVLVRPQVTERWAGDREQAAFDRPRPPGHPDRMAELAVSVLLPAARQADFNTFAPALGEYNRLAGEPFAADQGGLYAGPEVTTVVETLRSWGWSGVGQSSWGPTVFAICPDERTAWRLADRCRDHFADLDDVTVTAAKNDGARTLFHK